jgi:hypothetical protein
MRNARTSPLRNHGLKNGKNRDGNEKARKGLGCTNRSCRFDWLPNGMTWGALKIKRREPIMVADDLIYVRPNTDWQPVSY